MDIQVASLLLSAASLVAIVFVLAYTVTVHRRNAYIRRELSELQRLGSDAWVAKHIARWERGELKMRLSRWDAGVVVHFIEPLPGWRISLEGELARRAACQ